MSHQTARQGGIIPVLAAAALTKGSLVKLDGNKQLVACTAADFPFGSLTEDVAIGEYGSVAIPGAIDGTVFLVAHDNAIVFGETLIPAAAGRVDGGATGKVVAIALEASTAQGHLIECALRTPVTV